MSAEFSECMYYESGRHLFRTVIRRAQQEADGIDLILTTRKETQEQLQKEAREWITTDSVDLRMLFNWCDFGDDYGYEEFVEEMKRRYGDGNEAEKSN